MLGNPVLEQYNQRKLFAGSDATLGRLARLVVVGGETFL